MMTGILLATVLGVVGPDGICNDRIDIGTCEYDGCEAVGKGYLLILR